MRYVILVGVAAELMSEIPKLFGKCSGSTVCSMHPVSPAGGLVGRDSEMALLTGLVKEVARGRGGSVLIEGEPGIGKSTLVRAAVAEAPQAGCQVFWGAGDELEPGAAAAAIPGRAPGPRTRR